MRQAIRTLVNKRGQANHAGLLLQRYLAEHTTDSSERRMLLDAVLTASQSDSLCAMYSDAFERWIHALPTDIACQARQLATTSRLVVGLGAENVLEAGLRLHHTYGVPIIPGSALKGLASHYCDKVWGQQHSENAAEENQPFRRGGGYHSLLFGTTEDGGVITFHDAWITPASQHKGSLHLDVMTPHHPNWQINGVPPTDFDSPVPVSFLSAAGTFEIRLSWSGPVATPSEQAEAWTALAMQLLEEALAEWGIGGKTSSGYGRLVSPDSPGGDDIHQPSTDGQAKEAAPPKPGDYVEAVLLKERTKKGGWRARHELTALAGPIQNSATVPNDKDVGNTLTLIVASISKREMHFRYPTPVDEQRAAAQKSARERRPRGKRR